MYTDSSVTMKAPLRRIFEITSNLDNWVPMLPHYRFINWLGEEDDGARIVEMACYRGKIPVSWTSRLEIDEETPKVTFTHLKKMTKGMVVVWTYEETDDGVLVKITHDLKFRWPPLAPLAEYIIGEHFIDPVAGRTLRTFKEILEKEASESAA